MKTASLIVVLALSLACSAFGSPHQDARDALQDAQDLTREGKYEEALQKFLWYWEASRNVPGQGGVRLSFALSYWVELAEKYPKAESALVDIRDTNEKRLLEGLGDSTTFHEYASINKHLKDEDKTFSTFKILHDKYPKQARQYFYSVQELLVAHHEYLLCSSYIPNPQAALRVLQYFRDMQRKGSQDNQFVLKSADRLFENGTRQLIEILVGAGRQSEAEAIQKEALSTLDTLPIRSAIRDAETAIRAWKPQI